MSDDDNKGASRREFITTASSLAMLGGLAGGYGAFAATAGKFLYNADSSFMGWMFVAPTSNIQVGDSIAFRTPSGANVTIVRKTRGGLVRDFLALSSTCPHLGCQVSWEPNHNRFFCPCHNGIFNADGIATDGPPGDAGQKLPQYRLQIEEGLLYIEVPTEELAMGKGEVCTDKKQQGGSGHDPCLERHPRTGPKKA